jgi:RNA polymerase I-specific transcription initiation factor RRN3
VLASSTPYKGKPTDLQEVFFRNVLYISEYLPSLSHELLELMVDHMAKLDADLPWLSEVVDVEGKKEEEVALVKGDDPMFDMDIESPPILDDRVLLSSPGDQPDPPTLHPTLTEPPVMENSTAEKLDVLMTLCFEHLHRTSHTKGVLDVNVGQVIFCNLLKVFEKIILTTIGSTHVQFLVFYFCTFSNDFVKEFLDFLWLKFSDVSTPTIYRVSSMVYMTNFVSRAKFVSLRVARECLSVVMEWAHQYIDGVAGEQMRPDIRIHSPFYAACQGMFYVVVFRHKEFEAVPWGMEFLQKLNFDRLISTRLNPLKLCLPSVVEKFAQITKQMELVFCYSIMEHNKRVIIDVTNTLQMPEAKKLKAHLSVNSLLDSFFPFDPYCLKRSHKFVKSHYVEWTEEDDSSSESDEMDDRSEKTDPFLEPSPGFYGSISPP